MKFILTLKTPDVADDSIQQELEGSDLDPEQLDLLRDEMKEVAAKYVQYGEYVRIELDTENGSAKVIPVRG